MSKFEQARCRYAHDLRVLRESKGISLDEIHDETRIIKSVLQEFELNCLYENHSFNKIYLQSLTKKYAEVVRLDIDLVLDGLAMVLEGNYDGRLNPKYEPKELPTEAPTERSGSMGAEPKSSKEKHVRSNRQTRE